MRTHRLRSILSSLAERLPRPAGSDLTADRQPRVGRTAPCLDSGDGLGMTAGHIDVVHALKQAVLAHRIDLEFIPIAGGPGDDLVWQIDRHGAAWPSGDGFRKIADSGV